MFPFSVLPAPALKREPPHVTSLGPHIPTTRSRHLCPGTNAAAGSALLQHRHLSPTPSLQASLSSSRRYTLPSAKNARPPMIHCRISCASAAPRSVTTVTLICVLSTGFTSTRVRAAAPPASIVWPA